MHLKSLTLKGFKSFAQPTTLVFEPGVTCVVGPNGSGKSNVVDALAWVMGEQGAKSLRGGKMEDVIFAGTATRGPLGRAEVTLTIDNHDGVLPIEYSEVTIRRTLFRNGGSEYAVNGEGVRLLDVQELLSDTGLGREMHVIVGQGRLDSVLHATPEERRGFIEEAAGILKHRRRKERTVRKLEGMEQNLTRLRDLTGEVRRRLKPLGRQAEAARRAHGIAAIARDARARIMADDVARLRGTLREASESGQGRRAEREVLQERLARAVAAAERIVAAQRGDAVDAARRTVFDLESVAERLRNLELLAAQREALLQQRLETPDFTPSVTVRDVDDARAESVVLDERAAAAAAEWTAAGAATREAREALDEVDQHIQQASTRASRYAVREQELKGAAETAASRLAAVRGDVLRQTYARDAARTRSAEADEALARIDADTSQGETDSSGLDEAHDRARHEVTTAETALEALREHLHELERERDALDARATALALATRLPDAAGALLDAGLPGVRGTVTEHVRVVPGGEGPIATALGELADAVLVAGTDEAIGVIGYARDGAHGRVELVVDGPGDLGPLGEPDDAVRRALDEPGARRAIELLEDAPDAVRRLLAPVVVVDDLDRAREIHGATRALTGELVLVTRGGEVLAPSTMRGGSGGTGRSRLELGAERERATARLAQVRDEIDRLSIAVAEHRGGLEQARAGQAAALGRLRAFDADLAQRREALNRAQARRDAARAELARAGKALEVAAAGVAEAESRATSARAALDAHRAEPKPVVDGTARDAAAALVESARDTEVEARLRVETLRERARAESARSRQLAERLDAERATAERAARETVLRRRELVRTERVLAALPLVTAAVAASVEEARVRLRAAQAEREAQDAELVLARRDESDLRSGLAALADDVHAIELLIAERGLELRGLLERVASELGLTEAVLVAEYGPNRLVPGDDDALRSLAERAAEAAAAAAAARAGVADEGAGRASDADADAQTDAPPSARQRLAATDAEPGLGDLHASDEERATAALAAPGVGGAGGGDVADAHAHADRGSDASSTDTDTDTDTDTGVGDTEQRAVRVEPEDGVPFVRAEQERRLAGAERQLAQLGRVNPLALEEFAALEQRHGFLVAQLDDLERTRTDLLEIVGEIDERMRTVFEAAFEDTRRAFHEVFPVLFPGGEGDITLTLPDDMLRTGIEVTVKPAGKKIERLTLLSGGERSLAAVALLIAIFKARPSPFYIMDEVEAALDDANLGRLLQVFRDLRASSQLIVITHQKRTMEIADALYGVSMRRDGVSAVVGQRIEHAAVADAGPADDAVVVAER